MNRGFTEQEAKILSRSLKQHGKRPIPEWVWILAITVEILFVGAYTADNVLHLTQVAHAEEIHQNDYYCQHIDHYVVLGATLKDIENACK